MYRLLKGEKVDEDSDEELEDIDSDNGEKDNEAGDGGVSDDGEDDELEVPDDYIFPAYFAFILWGTFALPDD